VSCASELTYEGVEGDRHILVETMVYQAWNCAPTTLRIRGDDAGLIDVEQVGGDGTVCCRGTFRPVGADVLAGEIPVPGAVPGIGTATSVVALGGTGTQYSASTDGLLWMPLDNVGLVARVDTAAGTISGTTKTGDPGAARDLRTDPHGVAAGDGRVWVARAADRSVAPLDPSTGALGASIPIDATPYALAIDGSTLWATSFEDDLVIRVDLSTSKIIARIPVSKPTGIAVGAKAVWVVRHRDDAIDRIDPARNMVVATIKLDPPGPSDVCGRCVENVVVAHGSVWTADNEARVVTRIDPTRNKVAATITVPHRVWSVTAGGGAIWASQFESTNDGGFDPSALGIVRIDPASNGVTTATFPVFGVTWASDSLWALGPGRRGDLLYRISVDP
jgi:hypothetical protein